VNVVVVENVTVTVRLLFIVTVHCLLSVETESQPLQLCTAEPASGVAVSVTVVFLAKLAEHVVPQLIPAGLLVTVPLPVLTTVSVTNACETPALEPMKRASTAHPAITQNIFRYPVAIRPPSAELFLPIMAQSSSHCQITDRSSAIIYTLCTRDGDQYYITQLATLENTLAWAGYDLISAAGHRVLHAYNCFSKPSEGPLELASQQDPPDFRSPFSAMDRLDRSFVNIPGTQQERVIAPTSKGRVRPWPTLKEVIPRATVELVIAGAAAEYVIPFATIKLIIPVPSLDFIVIRSPVEHIVV
jgi:hypothetical protein